MWSLRTADGDGGGYRAFCRPAGATRLRLFEVRQHAQPSHPVEYAPTNQRSLSHNSKSKSNPRKRTCKVTSWQTCGDRFAGKIQNKIERNEEPLAFALEVVHMEHGSTDPLGRFVGTDSGT